MSIVASDFACDRFLQGREELVLPYVIILHLSEIGVPWPSDGLRFWNRRDSGRSRLAQQHEALSLKRILTGHTIKKQA